MTETIQTGLSELVGLSWEFMIWDGKEQKYSLAFLASPLTIISLLIYRKERPIFGKIRYMNYAGCKRKFKLEQFVARYRGASENAAIVSGAKSGGEVVSGKKRKQTSISFPSK
jgi:hypothetical protein